MIIWPFQKYVVKSGDKFTKNVHVLAFGTLDLSHSPYFLEPAKFKSIYIHRFATLTLPPKAFDYLKAHTDWKK